MIGRGLFLLAIVAVAAACGDADRSAPSPSVTPAAPPAASSTTSDRPPAPPADPPADPTPSTSTAEIAATAGSTDTTTTDPTPTSCVDDLDLRAVAGLVTWPAAEASRWDDVVTAVDDHGVGGVLLMRPDGWSSDEVASQLAELEARSQHGLVVTTDEEGGVVQRLRVLGELPSQRELAALADRAGLDAVRELIGEHGAAVRGVGVDVVFGPVIDVEPTDASVPLEPSRFFPGEPDRVAAVADAVIAGWIDAGLLATAKHFPGHGAASGDTHDVDGVTPPIEQLAERDLVPYRELGGRVASGELLVMVGHLTVPGLTDGLPATRSPAAIDLLRSLDGYGDALVVTDALGMAAVGLPEPEAAVAALAAGIDAVVFTRTSQTGPVVDAIVDAVTSGRLDEAGLRSSAGKVMRVLERDGHTCGLPAAPTP